MKNIAMVLIASLLVASSGASPQVSGSTHEQAVVELFKIIGLEQTMLGGATAMIDAQVQSNPALAPYRDVLLEWASRYLTWDTMAPSLMKLHVEAFSESEIRDLIAFYRTPTGNKALTMMPELMQKGAAIGMEVAKAHQGELEEMIAARQKELESDDEP